MLISVIVPSRGRTHLLEDFLNSLRQQILPQHVSYEVLIGLDADPDEAKVHLDLRDHEHIHYAGHQGISETKNIIIQHSQGDLILLMNDDVRPRQDFLNEHLNFHREGKQIVLGNSPWKLSDTVCLLDQAIANTRMIFFYEGLQHGQKLDHRHAWNLNLSVDRQVIEEHDMIFDPRFQPCMFEDLESAYRWTAKGLDIYYNANAIAVHDHQYQLSDYFIREALLGIMTPTLYEISPQCYHTIFPEAPQALKSKADILLGQDKPDAKRILDKINELALLPMPTLDKAKVDLFYAAHLPLKRRAFRVGLSHVMENPLMDWKERPQLAELLIRQDQVFELLFDE